MVSGGFRVSSPLSTKYDVTLSRLKHAVPDKDISPPYSVTADSVQYPVYSIILGQGNPKRALISAGIHGDEPAGVETILTFLEKKLFAPYLDSWELTLLPCINPSGFNKGTRENADGVDLNRKFRDPAPPEEVRWVQSHFQTPFDLDLELHEDIDSPGYYLYQKENGSLSELGRSILDQVAAIMPLNDLEEIEEMPAQMGLLARLSDPDEMEWWPMALYAFSMGCRRAFTAETATCFPMEIRVEAHLRAIETALTRFED